MHAFTALWEMNSKEMAAYLECQQNCLNFKDFADKQRHLTTNWLFFVKFLPNGCLFWKCSHFLNPIITGVWESIFVPGGGQKCPPFDFGVWVLWSGWKFRHMITYIQITRISELYLKNSGNEICLNFCLKSQILQFSSKIQRKFLTSQFKMAAEN